jgi:hypothetical protein
MFKEGTLDSSPLCLDVYKQWVISLTLCGESYM